MAGLAAAAGLLVAALFGAAAPAKAKVPGGKIAIAALAGECSPITSLCPAVIKVFRPGRKARTLPCASRSGDECYDRLPVWSADGKALATATQRPDPIDRPIAIRRRSGTVVRRLAAPAWVIDDLAWGPGARRLAYNYAGGLFTLDSLSSRRRFLRQTGNPWVAWSRQGRLAWSQGTAAELWTTDRAGRRAHKLGVRGSAPRWSPGGGRVAYFDSKGVGLRVVNRDGTGRRLIARRCRDTQDEEMPDRLAWSPDGRYIACTTGVRELIAINVKTGRALPGPGSVCP